MFRFTIRELLLLTLVVGLVIGWALDHWGMSMDLRHAESWEEAAKSLANAMEQDGWTVKIEPNGVSAEKEGVG